MRALLAAFNKRIAVELQDKLNSPPDRSGWTWTTQQKAIFDWFESGEDNKVVRARAGTGKTTVIMEGIARLPGVEAEALTLHSAGYRIVRRYWEGVRIDDYRRRDSLALFACGDQTPDPIVRLVSKLVGLGMECAPLAEKPDDLFDLAWEHECIPDPEWEDDGYGAEEVCAMAYKAMLKALERTKEISFADMIYLPVRQNWIRPAYDLVVIDEAQDMNAAQLELARRLSRGRVCVVGDDRQAIYGFRGADSGAIDRLKAELKASELGLTVTYRCGQQITALAANYVPGYAAAPTNPQGTIEAVSRDKLVDLIRPGEVVLSRLNAPLFGHCLRALRAGKPARIEGRDVAAGLRALIRKLAKGPAASSIPAFLKRLSWWEEQQVHRIENAKPRTADSQIENVRDKASMLRELAQDASGVRELTGRLDTIFSEVEAGRCTVFSSVHRAKGLEWDRVYILRDTLRTEGRNGNPPEQEELNIAYVAITRAINTLIWVD